MSQPLVRIDTPGGNVSFAIAQLQAIEPARLLYAEGDSWFDKFTPLGVSGMNLLDAIRLPVHGAVIDVSQVGAEAEDVVTGREARQTRAMFDTFDFDALLLSVGGNDLIRVFTTAVAGGASRLAPETRAGGRALRALLDGGYDATFDALLANITSFIALRDGARREKTRDAPLVIHGYDFLQPRPAGAIALPGGGVVSGPWIYPALAAAGLTSAQMRTLADSVVDDLNQALQAFARKQRNVLYVDQRGTLIAAAPDTSGSSNDWMDEIHPNPQGFRKLAQRHWNPLLAALVR